MTPPELADRVECALRAQTVSVVKIRFSACYSNQRHIFRTVKSVCSYIKNRPENVINSGGVSTEMLFNCNSCDLA